MKIEITPDEARVFIGFIDATLKSKGYEALKAAARFNALLEQAALEEQNEKTTQLQPPHSSPANQGG